MSKSARYFKHRAESDLGDGEIFLEVVGDEVVRQVEIYGSKLIWCDGFGQSDERFMLADQPFSSLGLTSADEVSVSDFEHVWLKAKAESGANDF